MVRNIMTEAERLKILAKLIKEEFLTIPELIEYLKYYSRIDIHGMAGKEVRVPKEALRQAAVIIEDYLECFGEL